MEQHFRNNQANKKIFRKSQRIFLFGTEKKESKKLKNFQKLLEQISKSTQYNRAGRARTGEEMFKRKLTKNQTYLGIPAYTIPNNPSEEAVFGSDKIKEEHKTMTLQNEKVMFQNT